MLSARSVCVLVEWHINTDLVEHSLVRLSFIDTKWGSKRTLLSACVHKYTQTHLQSKQILMKHLLWCCLGNFLSVIRCVCVRALILKFRNWIMDEKVDVISRRILLLLLLYWCCPGKRPNLVWKVTKQKEKKRHKRGREMKMKSLKSDMHTWHAQTLSTCANILKQIFRHHLPLSRGADWFTQMLLLSLSLWREQLKVKA